MSIKRKKLEDKIWKNLSKLIRVRDCIKTTGNTMSGKCITCDHIFLFSQLQAGHFIHGHGNNTHWDERNIHAQCGPCNQMLHGRINKYYPKMIDMYGLEFVEDLKRRKYIPLKISDDTLIKLNIDIKKRTKELIESVKR